MYKKIDYNSWIDIIQNNIDLLNCIFRKKQNKNWIELKKDKELYYLSYNYENENEIGKSEYYQLKDIYHLNMIILDIIYNNLDHLKSTIEKQIIPYNNDKIMF